MSQSADFISLDYSQKNTYTFPLVMSIICALFGSFQFGYHIGVMNAPMDYIQKELDISDTWYSVIVSIWAIGGWVGGSTGANFADNMGRARVMVLNNLFLISAAIMMFMAQNYWHLVVARLIAGIGCGVATVVVPMYISELAPATLRGSLGSCVQLGCVTGILVSQVLGLPLHGDASWWRILLLLSAVPSFLQLILAPCFLLRSPRYVLCIVQDIQEAETILQSIRGYDDVSMEIECMKLADGGPIITDRLTLVDVMYDKGLRYILSLGIILQIAQQLSGINAIMFYSSSFFDKLDGVDPIYGTILVGAVNAIFTLISMLLVEKLGRRFLLISGTSVMAITCFILTISLHFDITYLSITCILLFVGAFEIGLGPIAWLMISEIFPNRARAAGMSIAVAMNWLLTFVVGGIWPRMNEMLGNWSFVPFLIVQVAFIIYGLCGYIPETKGKSLEKIEEELLGTLGGISRTSTRGGYDALMENA